MLAAVQDLVRTFHLAEPSGHVGFSEGDRTRFGPPAPLDLDATRILRGGVVQRAGGFAYPPPVLFAWSVVPLDPDRGLVQLGFDLYYGAPALYVTRWRGLQHRHALFGRASVRHALFGRASVQPPR